VRLSANGLVHYLLDRRILDPAVVTGGTLQVIERSRRNRNYLVRRPPLPGLFVKQVQQWVPQAAASLQREASCYWAIASQPAGEPLRGLVPQFEGHDPARQLLITRLIEDSENLGDQLRRTFHYPVGTAKLLGRLLGTCHRHLLPALQAAGQAAAFPGEVPWILQLPQQAAQGLSSMSAGNAELVRLLGQYPDFQTRLQQLAGGWRRDTMIHGDLKWDNLLVGQADHQVLRLVDWELADSGDPCWDVGAVLQGFLASWLASMPDTANGGAEYLMASARHPLDAMLPAVRAFWAAYRDHAPDHGLDGAALLARSVACAGARMIQTAYEYLQYSGQISTHALRLLQLSLNVLTRPADAQRDLLGL